MHILCSNFTLFSLVFIFKKEERNFEKDSLIFPSPNKRQKFVNIYILFTEYARSTGLDHTKFSIKILFSLTFHHLHCTIPRHDRM